MKSIFLFLSVLTGVSLLTLSCQEEHINKIPVVDAGASKALTLPNNSLTLTGTASDPDGEVVAYLWSQVSGPGATTIVDPGSASTQIKGFLTGTYQFQLMAVDNEGATGVDTTSVTVSTASQQTLNLQPANNPYEFLYAIFNGADQSGSGSHDIPIAAWTNGGTPINIREAIRFDLSSIPSNSTIISANLYLYSYPPPTLNGNFVDANFGTSNSMSVQQIVTNWSPSTTNWFNQPVTTTTNQIVVPQTNQSMLDLNLDVTNMVRSMVSTNANYGFFMRLQTEVLYNSRIFVSSYSPSYPAKRPKLVIIYQ